jgi:hypothetical protein
VPAAAVIPAPIAYIKIVAVKKLVVGSQVVNAWCVFLGTTMYSALLVVSYCWCSLLSC